MTTAEILFTCVTSDERDVLAIDRDGRLWVRRPIRRRRPKGEWEAVWFPSE